MTLIDIAEMYADGGAEMLVGEAIAGCRDEVFLISKVLAEHATRSGTVAACERGLQCLGTDRLDLYLLHWRGNVPLEETFDGFAALVDVGKIRYWGVSNFDVVDMIELRDLISGADVAAARSCTILRGAASSTNCYLGAANEAFRSLPIRPSSKRCSLIAQVRDNRAALELRLTRQDFAALDCAFPALTEATPLAML